MPRTKSGFAKDKAVQDIDKESACQLKELLKFKLIQIHGNDCKQVDEMANGSYYVESTEFDLICELFGIRLRVSADHQIRSYTPKHMWENYHGREGDENIFEI